LTPAGAPAVGVRVVLQEFHDKENELESEGISCGPPGEDDADPPDIWPKSWTSDETGRFRIEGTVPEKMFARLCFRHPEFADDDVVVSSGLPLSDWLRAFDVKPVGPTFTHTLEPARPVAGVVTNKTTGQPLAGVLVEMIAARMHKSRYGGNVRISARTDAAGRYRAAGAAETPTGWRPTLFRRPATSPS
jgi:hypothetical protein